MVKAMGLAMALWAALGLAGAPALLAADLSPTAAAQEDAELAALPARPAPLQREPNVAWEDFTASTLVSMPFTAFWALLGALLVGGVAQQRFPPEFDQNLLAGAAAAAGAASLTVGLVSVKWGGSKDPGSAAAGPAKP
jgi:hypothetical protein